MRITSSIFVHFDSSRRSGSKFLTSSIDPEMADVVVVDIHDEPDNADTSEKVPPIRFNCRKEIYVLREAVAVNPFIGRDGYKEMAKNLSDSIEELRTISERRCRAVIGRLLTIHRSDESKSHKSSGTTEEFDERRRLLEELAEMEDDAKTMKEENEKQKGQARNAERAVAMDIRKKAMESLKRKESDTDEDTENKCDDVDVKRKRATKKDFLNYLTEKNMKKDELRREEIANEKKRLELEEKRMLLETERIEHERKERAEAAAERNVLMQLLIKKL